MLLPGRIMCALKRKNFMIQKFCLVKRNAVHPSWQIILLAGTRKNDRSVLAWPCPVCTQAKEFHDSKILLASKKCSALQLEIWCTRTRKVNVVPWKNVGQFACLNLSFVHSSGRYCQNLSYMCTQVKEVYDSLLERNMVHYQLEKFITWPGKNAS